MVESRLAKAAGAEPAGQMRDEKLHAVVARSACPSQNARNTPSLEHFLKLRCGKSARVVAQSTFPSQNVQNTPGSKHFWQLRCRKSARRCGATRISKSKRTKPFMFGALLEVQISKKVHALVAQSTFPSQNVKSTTCSEQAVEMSKECTPLWRDARFQVKMYKRQHVWSLFGSSRFRCRKSARCCGVKHISEPKCSKHYMFGPLLDVQMSFVRPAQGIVHLVKWAKCEGFLACPKTMAGVGHLWIRPAIRDSQQPTSPIGFLFFETSATALRGTTGIPL